MRSLQPVNIAEYTPTGSIERPIYLDSNVFYNPVNIRSTPELEVIADQAVTSLMEDGYYENEAVRYVSLRIHAAASFAITAASQEELQTKIMETPTAPAMRGRDKSTIITPSEAIDIAPFLPHVSPYSFDLDEWLLNNTEITENWEVTRPSLRWLRLWETTTSSSVIEQLLNRCVKIEGLSGLDQVAIHSSKILQVLKDKPAAIDQLLGALGDDQTLALFGELGSDNPYIGDWADPIKDNEPYLVDEVQQVRHVDHFAGGCSKMTRWHISSLLHETDWGPEAYGDVVLISVKGTLVGSLEMVGEHSLLALKNIKDSNQKLPLVAGGVYVPRKEIVDKAKAIFVSQGKWAHMDLDKLRVRPLRFLNIGEPHHLHSLNQTLADINSIYPELADKVN